MPSDTSAFTHWFGLSGGNCLQLLSHRWWGKVFWLVGVGGVVGVVAGVVAGMGAWLGAGWLLGLVLGWWRVLWLGLWLATNQRWSLPSRITLASSNNTSGLSTVKL